MEKYLEKNFSLPAKNSSPEVLKRWRQAVSIVKNPKRRFRNVADLEKRTEAEEKKKKIKERIRVVFIVQTAALTFIDAGKRVEWQLPQEVRDAGFSISPNELASIVQGNDKTNLRRLRGVEGIAEQISTSLKDGVSESQLSLRQNIFGYNQYVEKPTKSFLTFLLDLQLRAGQRFKDLDKEKKKIFVQVTRDGYRKKVSIYDLVVGDIVHLSIGDQVPADGLFISGYSLLIDESSLSGESDPVNISKEKPFLLAGTKVQDGSGRLLVEKGIHGAFLKWSSSDAMKILNYFAVAVTIIVVAVPEGLPLAVTLSLAFAMKKLMNDRALVRHLSACETMGSASCICTDKTGTLTTNHMEVEKSIFQNTGSEVVKEKDGKNTILGTPTESAILEFGLHLGGDFDNQRQASKIIKVEPFNSDKKKMSVLVSLPGGEFRAFSKGASEIILCMCDKIVDRKGNLVSLTETQRKHAMDVINGFACEALRTLSFAFKDINENINGDTIPEDGYTLISVVGIKDPVRPGVKDAVQSCLAAGITVRMVTGDNINTAKAIAKECGILTDDGLAIEGADFRTKSPQEMKELIPKIQVMARSLPSDKHVLVKNLRTMDEVVAVTGDGTNDAPALHEADIGLAMGIAGTEVAKESADVIIMDDNFSTIVNVAKWGRSVYINIQKFVQFQLTVNVVALIVNFASACIVGTAPLTAVQLLWVNMIMDTLGALALATEPPNDELMKRKPVGRGVSFITRTMWRNIIGQSIYQLLVLGLLMFDGKRLLKLNGSDATAVLNTFIFNSFVFCQIVCDSITLYSANQFLKIRTRVLAGRTPGGSDDSMMAMEECLKLGLQ
ncbi:hypothetical protein MRB53_009858 [Persea americana]|uniref:Uncharacterized protein n=1 Tax=Persea americana TaxID=3435 RepID=A0ACC2LQ37_PERAE|nr:hypothetical protein MRB53_009858 [Persea americana]